MTATSARGDIVSPRNTKHITATRAPEELQIGDEMDSSMYLRPMYPNIMERMYMKDTGMYATKLCRLYSTPPTVICQMACMPMTRPTAISIFRWLLLSSGREPILLNRSLPDQARIVQIVNMNHIRTSFCLLIYARECDRSILYSHGVLFSRMTFN